VPDWRTDVNPDVLLNAVWPRPLAYHAATTTRDLAPGLVRRLRLYGVACARMVWDVLSADARNAVLLSERHADGRGTQADLRAAAVRMRYGPMTHQQQAANAAGWASAGFWGGEEPMATAEPRWNPAEASREAAKAIATRTAGLAPSGRSSAAQTWQTTWNTTFARVRTHQAELVRDIFPPPGYAPALHPDWRTATVLTLTRQMDAAGDFSAVPILADALQDAGCDDDTMLDRCRAESGVHCRGNWVVDLVLGRE